MSELVHEIMDSHPGAVQTDTDLEEVLEVLRRHELPGVPVADGDGCCIGVVTELDLVIGVDEESLDLPHCVSVFGGLVFLESLKAFEKRLREAFAATAAETMPSNPKTIRPDATVARAGKLIASSGHNRLPVTSEAGRLIGVVARVDVVEAMAHPG